MKIFCVFNIGLLFLGAGYRSRKNVMSGLVVKNIPQAIYSYENIFDIIIRKKLTAGIDQVEGEGLVDKIADLGLWHFFSSDACKLWERANYFIQKWGIKKSAAFFENRYISKGGPLQTQIFDVFKFQNGFIRCIGLDLQLQKMV